MSQRQLMYINGKYCCGNSDRWIQVFDPSTEQPIAEVPDGKDDDVSRAVAAARHAFDESGWRNTSAQERGRLLFAIANIIRQNSRERCCIR